MERIYQSMVEYGTIVMRIRCFKVMMKTVFKLHCHSKDQVQNRKTNCRSIKAYKGILL